MSSIGTGYDLYTSQFSPDGRVFQIEYAMKAVENSGTVIGLRGKDGIVLAAEKIYTSKLYEISANRRIFNIDSHVGMAVAGLITDARQLADTARVESKNYLSDFGSAIPVLNLSQRVANYMHQYTLYSSIRPFGCSVMFGSWTKENGAELYCVEPSGAFYGYWGCSAGKAKSNAKTEIEKLKLRDMNCSALVNEAAKIIYAIHDEVKDKYFELELSWIGEFTDGRHQRVPVSIHNEAVAAAKSAMEDGSDSDEDEQMS